MTIPLFLAFAAGIATAAPDAPTPFPSAGELRQTIAALRVPDVA